MSLHKEISRESASMDLKEESTLYEKFIEIYLDLRRKFMKKNKRYKELYCRKIKSKMKRRDKPGKRSVKKKKEIKSLQ